MRIKEIIISTIAMLFVCLIVFGAFKLESSFELPDSKILVSNFENGIVNTLGNEVSLLEFGNLAIENKSILGKGVKLEDGYLSLYGSEQTKLRDEFTFSMWFNVSDTTPVDPTLISRGVISGDAEQSPFSIRFSDEYTCFKTDVDFKLTSSEYGSYSFSSKKLFNKDSIKNEWHNVTVVFDKNILYYYFDGVLSSAEILPVELLEYATISNNNKCFEIGKGAFGNMNGMIDEICFYDYAVEKEEAIAFYTKGMSEYKNKLVVNLASNTAVINGVQQELPALVKENETAMISADFIVEKMGGKITFDEKDGYGRADITRGNDKISVWIMDTNAVTNGKLSKLNVYPVKKDEIILVPLRFVAEGLGAKVSWDNKLQEITIYYK